MKTFLSQLKLRHLNHEIGGLFAVCSSHPLVLETAMEMAVEGNRPLLIEATANQVNQSGGYTGMTPTDFAALASNLAESTGLPPHRLFIGADHLGPHVWKHEAAASAMEKSIDLANLCVVAGFHKIHLDTGIGCKDDPSGILGIETAADRAAILCKAAEKAAVNRADENRPLYVIGNEVPLPGGGLEEGGSPSVTDPGGLAASLEQYEKAFHRHGISAAWQRVMAIVVQPGVDFGDLAVAAYDRSQTSKLSAAHRFLPGFMTYEIHATDFQTSAALREMVEDHFLLLKVGPCLTFSFREAVFALANIENALPGIKDRSNIAEVMEKLMKTQPVHWRSHYRGEEDMLSFLRAFSYRDRIRYYWAFPEATTAFNKLCENLEKTIPLTLLRQYFPDLLSEIQSGPLVSNPRSLIKRRIRNALAPYAAACG